MTEFATVEEIAQMLMPVVAALIYSTWFFAKEYVDAENEKSLAETFDGTKFVATQGIGLIVAGVMMLLGQPITAGSMLELLLLYEGAIMSLDQGIKAVLRGNEKAARRHMTDAAKKTAYSSAEVYHSQKEPTEVEQADREVEEEVAEPVDEGRREFITEGVTAGDTEDAGEEDAPIINDGSSP